MRSPRQHAGVIIRPDRIHINPLKSFMGSEQVEVEEVFMAGQPTSPSVSPYAVVCHKIMDSGDIMNFVHQRRVNVAE